MNRYPGPARRTVRRLTTAQIAVLAAVDRLGNPTVPELAAELDGMLPSQIVRVLDALERREKVVVSGCRFWIYLGDPAGIPEAPQISPDDIVRYRAA